MSDDKDKTTMGIGDDHTYDHLDHLQLMSEIRDLPPVVYKLLEECIKTLNSVNKHNIDLEAHPTFKKEIADNLESMERAIEVHNQSTASHPWLNKLLTDIQESINNAGNVARPVIEELINFHNSDYNAHNYIRKLISDLSDLLKMHEAIAEAHPESFSFHNQDELAHAKIITNHNNNMTAHTEAFNVHNDDANAHSGTIKHHNADPDAHGSILANHNIDTAAHEQIIEEHNSNPNSHSTLITSHDTDRDAHPDLKESIDQMISSISTNANLANDRRLAFIGVIEIGHVPRIVDTSAGDVETPDGEDPEIPIIINEEDQTEPPVVEIKYKDSPEYSKPDGSIIDIRHYTELEDELEKGRLLVLDEYDSKYPLAFSWVDENNIKLPDMTGVSYFAMGDDTNLGTVVDVSVSLATEDDPGIVRIGKGLDIDPNGLLSIPYASRSDNDTDDTTPAPVPVSSKVGMVSYRIYLGSYTEEIAEEIPPVTDPEDTTTE